LNTVIDAIAYFILTRLLRLTSYLILAKGIAYAIGMVNSFYWNRTWTFRSNANPWRAGLLFAVTHVFALAINAGVMAVSLNSLGLSKGVSLVLATGTAFCWNFGLNKLIVFKS